MYFFRLFFYKIEKKEFLTKFVFYGIAFDPIRLFTSYSPQNDLLNLSFVKGINTVIKKMTRNDFVYFSSSQTLRSHVEKLAIHTFTIHFFKAHFSNICKHV